MNKNNQQINIVIDKRIAAYIKMIAREKAVHDNRYVTTPDIIRHALSLYHPLLATAEILGSDEVYREAEAETDANRVK